jgi:hypothetical protein
LVDLGKADPRRTRRSHEDHEAIFVSFVKLFVLFVDLPSKRSGGIKSRWENRANQSRFSNSSNSRFETFDVLEPIKVRVEGGHGNFRLRGAGGKVCINEVHTGTPNAIQSVQY